MSTQLILYPQTYDGMPNIISASTTQKIVDGISFNSINTSSSYDAGSLVSIAAVTAMNNAPANIINTWYRYRSTTSGTPALPTQTGGGLVLSATTTDTNSGVYQKLSNLIVGAPYAVSFIWTGGTTGNFRAWHKSGSTGNISSFGSPTSVGLFYFYANFFPDTVNDDEIAISFEDTVASTVTITEITCVQVGVEFPQFGNHINLPDGQVICDLYQEEDIPLTISIDDFKNVAEQVQSYSKDFSLPATKRNNQIFNNMFEVTRADDGLIFNPYVRTQCVLKQDGFILFQGYLRMLDVQDQEGEISYNVNLYSEVIALADILKERTFAELDFSELQHDYNKDSIKNSWLETPGNGLPLTNALTDPNEFAGLVGATVTQVLKYPFIDWTGQINIADANSATSTNIGCPELTTLQQAFRPSIQLKYLINKIFVNTPFTWTSNFFDSADFDRLFLDYNWGLDQMNPYGEGEAIYEFGSLIPTVYADFAPNWTILQFPQDVTFGTVSGYDSTTGVFTAINDSSSYTINYNINSYCTLGKPAGNEFTIEWYRNNADGSTASINTVHITGVDATDINPFIGSFTEILMTGDELYCRFQCTVGDATTIQEGQGYPYSKETISGIVSIDVIGSGAFSMSERGKIKQWEFLKGIMTMFNLVSMVDDTNLNNILIEPYSDVFIKNTNGGNSSSLTLADRSIEYDWTDKVDVSQMQLTPLTDLNKTTVFKFVEDDDDYVFNVYRASTSGHLYGSKLFDASGFTVLEGTKEIIAEPFGATVSKPLFDIFPDFITPAIYAKKDDGTTSGFNNSPRILYNNGKISTGTTYYIPAQNGLSSENQSDFLQFSHLSAIPTIASTPPVATDTRDFVFESSQLFSPIGASPTNNLFNNYWLPYYAELYNGDTRLMTLKVNLTPSDINVFKMTDTIMIKNRSFRVNKIDYKPNDLATVEFILIP
tara:strand:+ start:1060 stop:3885 length:2826 start_codon:yes stop_codon:yes gene_type:complete